MSMSGSDELLVRAAIVDELSAPLKVIDAQVNALTGSLERLKAQGAAGGPGVRSLASLEGAAGKLGSSLKSAHGKLLDLSRGLTDDLVHGAKLAVEGVAALAAGLTFLGVKATGTFEAARVGIETFAGSVSKGDALFGQLKTLQGPFNITQLQDAAQAMLVASDGADHLIPRMKTLADVAATQTDPGAALTSLADALNRIQESGTLDTRSIRPLLTAGLPIYEMIAAEMGIPVDQVKKALASGAPLNLPVRFFADLEAETGPLARFQGAAEKQRGTLKGQFQMIKLDAQNELADVFTPLGTALKSVTPLLDAGLRNLIGAVGPGLIQFLTAVVGLAAGLLPILQPIATSLLGALATILLALVPALQQIAPEVPALATAFANMLIALVPLIPPLTALVVALVPVLTLAVTDLTSAITKVVGWLTPWINRLADLIDRSSAARTILADLFLGIMAYAAIAKVVEVVLGLARAIIAVKDAVVALQAAQGAGGLLRVLTGTQTATAAAGAAGDIEAVTVATGGFSAALGALTPLLSTFAAVAVPLLAFKLQKDAEQSNTYGSYSDIQTLGPKNVNAIESAQRSDANYWLTHGATRDASTFGDAYGGAPKAKADDSGYISTGGLSPADQAAWNAYQASQAAPPAAGGGGVTVHVQGDVVGETSGIFGRIRSTVAAAMAERDQQLKERK